MFCLPETLKKQTEDGFQQLCEKYFRMQHLCPARWQGKDEEEVGCCQETGVVHVKVDPKYFRPTEVVSLCCCVCSFHFTLTSWWSQEILT